MAGYLLIASRDPFESVEIQSFFGLAQSLSRSTETVTVLLIQNGVLTARSGEGARWIDELLRAGVEVLADELSLRERGIPTSRLAKQDPSGLVFGDRAQTQPPHLERDLGRLVEKGATVYLVEEDLNARGIQRGELIEGITQVSATTLPSLFGTFEHVWHW